MNFLTPLLFLLISVQIALPADGSPRPRLRDLGIPVGIFRPGPFNAITDVRGVLVGHVTLVGGDSIRTGVTAILPHRGNLFQNKAQAGLHVGNGFGKLVGSTQVQELGTIETPIVLTNTLSVWDAANGVVDYMLSLPGNERVKSINPVVGETNDGSLNDIRGRHVRREHAVEAIRSAHTGRVEEGCVGAGTGTVCFGWKGGIGTSSRVLPAGLGGYTIGVLVQTNYGGILDMAGVPVGKELGQYSYKAETGDGSCMIVVATDAPLSPAQLSRVAKRTTLALGRTGSAMSNGSGDYAIAFSTAAVTGDSILLLTTVRDERLSPLFQATVEAAEEAVYNSLLQATDTRGHGGTRVEALPIDQLLSIMKKYGKLR